VCALAVAVTVGALAAVAAAAPDDGDLRLVVMLTRHGVRSPLQPNAELDKYSAQPWPQWPVAPGVLTAHGNQQMVLMGQFYRELYGSQGLLAGRTEEDLSRIFFRADNDQRTIATAQALAAGLIPTAVPKVDARPEGQTDPLFRTVQVPVGNPDRPLGVAAVLGRLGGNPALIDEECRPAIQALAHVLYGPTGAPAAGPAAYPGPGTTVQPGHGDHTAELTGTMSLSLRLTDALLLEYAEGMPMSEVGWGRLTPEGLTQLLQLHSQYFNLSSGTFYPAQAQSSDLMDHILRTMDQAVTGQAQPGAFGNPAQRLVILVGHDTNIINVGGILGLNWRLPGTQLNPVLPGGALIFELRQHRRDGQYFVRTLYVSQTLLQTRTLEPLSLKNPPAVAPIFVPECSGTGPGFEAPLERFRAVLRRVIDPNFVVPTSS